MLLVHLSCIPPLEVPNHAGQFVLRIVCLNCWSGTVTNQENSNWSVWHALFYCVQNIWWLLPPDYIVTWFVAWLTLNNASSRFTLPDFVIARSAAGITIFEFPCMESLSPLESRIIESVKLWYHLWLLLISSPLAPEHRPAVLHLCGSQS